MDPPLQTQRKSREAAQWPAEISYFLLTLLINKYKDGRARDNGLRKKVWVQIAAEVNAKWNTIYDWEQTRNHYRIWKSRLRTLSDLQKDSGMGWNNVEHRFCAGHHRWADMKKKEQRYWKDHPMLPIHLKTLIWLGNEIATGNDATHPSELVAESNQEYHTPEVPQFDPNFDVDNDDEPGFTEIPSSQTEYSGRRRGRPCGGSSSSNQSKKKKGIADKLVKPLNNLVAALQSTSVAAIEREFSKEVNEVVNDMDMYDTVDKKAMASMYLMHHKWAANSILSAPNENRVAMLDAYMRISNFNP